MSLPEIFKYFDVQREGVYKSFEEFVLDPQANFIAYQIQ